MRRLSRLLTLKIALALCVLVGTNATASDGVREQAAPPVQQVQQFLTGRNMAGWLAIRGGQPYLEWRQSVDEPAIITAALDGTRIDIPEMKGSAESRKTTAVLVLFDTSDVRRNADVDQDKLAVTEIARHADRYRKIAIGTYGDSPTLINPTDHNLGALVNGIALTHTEPALANLGRALHWGIDVLSQVQAERKAIFVLTDGHTDDDLMPDYTVLRARQAGISLFFIVSPGLRDSSESALRLMSDKTAGLIKVGDTQREELLNNPLKYLESGGAAAIPVDQAKWKGDMGDLEVKLKIASEQLRFERSIPKPHLVWWRSALPAYRKFIYAILGIIIVALTAWVGVSWARRLRRRRPEPPKEHVRGAASERIEPILTAQGLAQLTGVIVESPSEMSVEELWSLIVKKIASDGRMPQQSGRLTPLEIAQYVRTRFNEQRVVEFVEQYYYPRAYGEVEGRWSYRDVQALIEELKTVQT